MRVALITILECAIAWRVLTRRHSGLGTAGLIVGLMAVLISASRIRVVGDGAEYLATALNLTQFKALELTPHFWLYPLLASPFVWLASHMGADPLVGFTALNLVLVAGLLWLTRGEPPAIVLLIAAGPLLWWIDKAHTETFTVAMLTAALLWLPDRPWRSLAALGLAAAQNPLIAAVLPIVFVHGLWKCGARDRRVWLGGALGLALAASHPVYYRVRFGTWSGLRDAIDWHWPAVREWLTIPIDLNLGLLVHDPFLVAAVAAAVVMLHRNGVLRPLFSEGRAVVALMLAVLLFGFTQTRNVNAGGTPGPSRYGLWLVPFVVPILRAASAQAWAVRGAAIAAMVWCAFAFAPALPDSYLAPSAIASVVWQRWPALENPVAEVFAERISGREVPSPDLPVSTAGCEKVLLIGDGRNAVWPRRCTAAPAPAACGRAGALCYANWIGRAYRFAAAPAAPTWRLTHPAATVEPEGAAVDDRHYVLPPDGPPATATWLQDGWSYLEHDAGSPGSAPPPGWRWMGRQATIAFESREPIRAQLLLVLESFEHPRRVKVAADGVELERVLVPNARVQFLTRAVALRAGVTIVTLESLDGTGRAPGDVRDLALRLFHVSLVPVASARE